jgi:hypothetical protein
MNMSPEKIIFIVSVLLVGSLIISFIYSKMPKKLKHDKFVDEWKKIQKLCADKTQWKDAVIKADELLDKALKKKKFKGVSMGERLVSAQKTFSNNDSVWFSHKLRNKVESDPELKLSKNDTKDALMGVGQALKDLGALKK